MRWRVVGRRHVPSAGSIVRKTSFQCKICTIERNCLVCQYLNRHRSILNSTLLVARLDFLLFRLIFFCHHHHIWESPLLRSSQLACYLLVGRVIASFEFFSMNRSSISDSLLQGIFDWFSIVKTRRKIDKCRRDQLQCNQRRIRCGWDDHHHIAIV